MEQTVSKACLQKSQLSGNALKIIALEFKQKIIFKICFKHINKKPLVS